MRNGAIVLQVMGIHNARRFPVIPTLHIRLFGEFQLLSGETPVTTVDLPRLQALLAYLVLYHGIPQSRSRLAYLFWPDTTDRQALSNLRTAVHRLRQALPNADSFLQVDRQNLQWRPALAESPWILDVQDFEDSLAQAEREEQSHNGKGMRQALESAISLYRGDLLINCYEEWILPERDRLRQAFLRALERLIVLLEREQDYESALRMAHQLLRHEPLHESTYRRLMRLHAALGDRAAALRVYHTCASVLERELGTEPSRATRGVYERLMHVEAKVVSQVEPQPAKLIRAPLVGRKPEWIQMQAIWRKISTAGMHLVVLSGEVGIGKTRLAEELVAWANRQGAAIATARCYAAESELAYAPVAAWLRNDALRIALPKLNDIWLTEVARLMPGLLEERPNLPQPGPLLESWQRQRLFEALARVILATRQPLLLLLDDMHRCDQETLEWLHYLFHFDPQAPLLLIGTMRPEEITAGHPLRTLLTALQRNHQVTEIPLEMLDASETAVLAEQTMGRQLDPRIATTLYKETEGNPLFIVEIVRAGLTERQAAGEMTLQSGSMLPPTLQAAIGTRLEHLSPLAQEVLRVASVIGRAFTFSVLAQVSKEDEDDLVQALDELWQRRIIREQGVDAYDFSHDKLREVTYATMSGTRRRLLHRNIAHALEQLHSDALDRVSGEIAAHYEHTGLTEQAIVYYQQAGEAAVHVYAHTEALALFQRALALLERTSPGESQRVSQEIAARLHERMGDVLALTGQLEQARNAYEHALALIPILQQIWQARLHCKIGNTWEAQRQNESALHAYTKAESILGQEPNESISEWWQQWIEIQKNRLQVYYWLAQVPEMIELIEKTKPIVEEYATEDQRATFFQSLCLMTMRRQHYVVSDEVLGYARAALSASQQAGNPIAIGWAHFNLGGVYMLRGNFEEAEDYLNAAVTLSEQTGDIMLQAKSFAFLTLVCRRRGQVLETQHSNIRAEGLAQRVQDAEFLGMAKANSAWIAWRQGDLPKAQADGKAALEYWQQTEVVYAFQWTALWPLIATAMKQNRPAQAMNYVHALLAPGQQRLPDTITTLLEAAIAAWNADQKASACACLQQTISTAQMLGYL
jgi:DNA-binding SARP family transcriptional activator/ATP/maltotriose-dependent transcriptional regulator MalT